MNDYQSWRLYDLIAWEHHVAFLVAVDPAKGKLWVHGGNQGSNDTAGSSITISHRSDLSAVNFISRNWEIPAEFDKPVIKSL